MMLCDLLSVLHSGQRIDVVDFTSNPCSGYSGSVFDVPAFLVEYRVFRVSSFELDDFHTVLFIAVEAP